MACTNCHLLFEPMHLLNFNLKKKEITFTIIHLSQQFIPGKYGRELFLTWTMKTMFCVRVKK